MKYTADDRAREIFQNDMIPAIADVANILMRREFTVEESSNAMSGEGTAKMYEIWQEVFDRLQVRIH